MQILSLQKEHHDLIPQIAQQFEKYYKSMEDKGLILKIVENGGTIWINSILSGLEKFQKVVLAVDKDKVAGFNWGYVHLAPPYVGKCLIGVWNGLYVEPEYRNQGLSKLLYL